MSIPTDTLTSTGIIDQEYIRKHSEYVRSLEEDIRLSDEAERELRNQIEMLEQEVDRQGMIIDALIKAIKVIERG